MRGQHHARVHASVCPATVSGTLSTAVGEDLVDRQGFPWSVPVDTKLPPPPPRALSTLGVQPLVSAMAQKIVTFIHRCPVRGCSKLFCKHCIPASSHPTCGCSQQLSAVRFRPGPYGRASIQVYGREPWNDLSSHACGRRSSPVFYHP